MSELRSDPPDNFPTISTESHDERPSKLLLEGFLRREELAEQLGISPRTIDRWQALRKGPPRVRIGRTILYDIRTVVEWLRSQEQQPLRKRLPVSRRRMPIRDARPFGS